MKEQSVYSKCNSVIFPSQIGISDSIPAEHCWNTVRLIGVLLISLAVLLGGVMGKVYESPVDSMSGAVREVLGKYPIDHEFGLWDLKRDVFKLYPPSKNNHADTVSRRLREFRHGRGYMIICINPNRSIYKKVCR